MHLTVAMYCNSRRLICLLILEYRILQKYCCKVVTFTRQNDRENYHGFESYERFIEGNNNAYKKKARHTIGILRRYYSIESYTTFRNNNFKVKR